MQLVSVERCPYCGAPAEDARAEVAHMNAEHPDVIAQRLEAIGERVESPSLSLAGAVDLLREAREILPHGAYAGWRHDERHALIKRIDAALGGGR